MNNEVIRLRQLRKTALKIRALASSLDTGKRDGSAYQRAAVLNWRIARIATGTLRSHPYESYQRDAALLGSAADRFSAGVVALWADMRGQGMRVFLDELKGASRQLDDARALTLSTELSDALGRAQKTMHALIAEVRCQVPKECAQQVDERAEPGAARMSASDLSASPYIAL